MMQPFYQLKVVIILFYNLNNILLGTAQIVNGVGFVLSCLKSNSPKVQAEHTHQITFFDFFGKGGADDETVCVGEAGHHGAVLAYRAHAYLSLAWGPNPETT